MKKKFDFRSFVLIVFVGFVFIIVQTSLVDDSNTNIVTYNEVKTALESGNAESIGEELPNVVVKMKGNKKLKAKMISNRLVDDKSLVSAAEKNNVSILGDAPNQIVPILWMIGSMLPFIAILVMLFLMISRSKGMGIGPGMGSPFGDKENKVSAEKNKKKVTFKDVAGLAEAKQDLGEVVEFLKNPFKFVKLGAKIPKGVLLLGRPGTGKTLLARAVAGEAGVPFFNVSGSEFVEMFVGVGAQRVRDLFSKAKKSAPCIVFIDEIDAVARQRGSGHGGGNDEREQTLNQLLVEMDGFETNKNIIVIAATNRPDVLDKAVARPGRFDRQVVVDAPSLGDREAILKLHAKNKPLAADADLRVVARKTAGMVGADLANILNEAAILAARYNQQQINASNMEEAVERIIAGPQRKSKIMSDKERKIVAFHEAGHALVAYALPNTDPVHKISIIPTGSGALGYTLQLPTEDKYLHSKQEFLYEMQILMGGRAAEEIIFKDITSGASNDIERATKIAKDMVTRYGMSNNFGPRALGQDDKQMYLGKDLRHVVDYSDETAQAIDKEVTKLIADAYIAAKKLLTDNLDKLKLLTEQLLEKEIIFGHEIKCLVGECNV